MKNYCLPLLALLLFTLCFSACTKDKRNVGFPGTWYLENVRFTSTVDGVVQEADTELFAENEVLFTFRPDQTYIMTSTDPPSSSESSYQLEGNKITMMISHAADTFAHQGTWTISGRRLTLNFSAEEVVAGQTYREEEIWHLNRMKEE